MKTLSQEFDSQVALIDLIKKELSLGENISVEFYLDSVWAQNEICRSLTQMYPHKMAFSTVGEPPSPMREILSGFAADGYNHQKIVFSPLLPGPGDIEAEVRKLKKETLFLSFSAIESFTGIVTPALAIEKWAWDSKVFTIRYESPDSLAHFGVRGPRSDFEAVILDPLWGQEMGLAIILKGDRVKGDKIFKGQSFVSEKSVFEFLGALKIQRKSENKEGVDIFENGLVAELGSFVKPIGSVSRVFDRSFLTIEGVNGEALQFKLQKAGFELETSSSCRWNRPKPFESLLSLGLSPIEVESSVAIPVETLLKKGFREQLVSEIKNIRNR